MTDYDSEDDGVERAKAAAFCSHIVSHDIYFMSSSSDSDAESDEENEATRRRKSAKGRTGHGKHPSAAAVSLSC